MGKRRKFTNEFKLEAVQLAKTHQVEPVQLEPVLEDTGTERGPCEGHSFPLDPRLIPPLRSGVDSRWAPLVAASPPGEIGT